VTDGASTFDESRLTNYARKVSRAVVAAGLTPTWQAGATKYWYVDHVRREGIFRIFRDRKISPFLVSEFIEWGTAFAIAGDAIYAAEYRLTNDVHGVLTPPTSLDPRDHASLEFARATTDQLLMLDSSYGGRYVKMPVMSTGGRPGAYKEWEETYREELHARPRPWARSPGVGMSMSLKRLLAKAESSGAAI